MKNIIKRTFCICLTLVLIMSLFTGCGNKGEDSKNKGESGGSDAGASFNVNPEDYRGTSITYVTWKDPANNEDGPVVEAFKKKYGIDVKVDLTDQGSYVNYIAASIASGTQGDIVFCNGLFPSALSVMQPLDAAKLNLKDDIWRQSVIKASTIDGHPYLVDAVSNVWSEVDVCIYNKALFDNNGITSPAEYYEEGKWNMTTFKKACQDIAALGKGYTGATVLGESFLGGCGASTFSFENDTFKTSIDQKYYDVLTYLADLYTQGLVSTSRIAFTNGKTGMAITNCFGLKRTGYFSTMNSNNIGVTYLPKFDEQSEEQATGIFRGWGLIRGAKNPEAAGIFLREYLDVNNYDLDLTFHNEDAANFFFEVTTDISDINYYYTNGLSYVSGDGEMGLFDTEVSWARSPEQVKSFIDSNLPTLNYLAEKGNELIKSEKKYIAENFSK